MKTRDLLLREVHDPLSVLTDTVPATTCTSRVTCRDRDGFETLRVGDTTAVLTMSERQSLVSASVRASSWAIRTSLDIGVVVS